MLRSAGMFEPSIEGCGRNPIGLPNFDHRKCLAVNQVVGGVGTNLQNTLHLFHGQDITLHLLTHKLLLCALRAEVYVVVKVHLLTRKAILQ